MKRQDTESPRILVVDDDDYLRLFLKEILEGNGYRIGLAEDGEEALAKIKSSPPDLVLTDLKMPKKDGLELLKDVSRLDEPIGVIIITAYGTIETAVKAMKDGAFDYLTKPFSTTEIESRLKRFFEMNTLRKELNTLRKENRDLQEDSGYTEVVNELDVDEERIFGRGIREVIDMFRDFGHLVRRK